MKLHFMKYRKLSYWISGICVLLSVLSIIFKGFNYGIDFSGGIAMEITPVNADYTVDKMRHDLEAFKPELQSIDGGSVLLRVGLPKGSTDEQQNVRVAEIKNILPSRNASRTRTTDSSSALPCQDRSSPNSSRISSMRFSAIRSSRTRTEYPSVSF